MNIEHIPSRIPLSDVREPTPTPAPHGDEPSRPAPSPRPMVVVCPYCGHESSRPQRCDRCRGLMDPLSRQASQNAMGPWFIRDDAAPFRPGCSYETLQGLIAKGRVNGASVIRGPSTRQFWTRATSVPGVAHLLGECHACHGPANAGEAICRRCGASFDSSTDRQAMGLAPVRLLPGHAAPEEIARSMVDAVKYSGSPVGVDAGITPTSRPDQGGQEESFTGMQRPPRRMGKIVIVAALIAAFLIVLGGITAWFAAPDRVGELLRQWSGS